MSISTKPALEDELGDVIEKAARNVPLSIDSLAAATAIEPSRLRDALDYRPDLTDGELVYVSFLDGKEMFIAAYDFSGNERWHVRPGEFSSVHGYCSSPVL